jgi:uncharacterized membrane protein YfcA
MAAEVHCARKFCAQGRGMSIEWLALAFLFTALIYSSVGFGGGSTYNALLLLAALPLANVPLIALVCNILVVCVGSWRFHRARAFDWRRFWPLAVTSVPAAWLGGILPVAAWLFVGLLALCLSVAGVLMVVPGLWLDRSKGTIREDPGGDVASRLPDFASGAALGLLAGITGIGGGIYLSPLLHLRRWGRARLIAGTSAAFILVNSIGGLVGQATKVGPAAALHILAGTWLLFPAVLLGGLAGSALGSSRISESRLRAITGLLILYVAIRLGLRFPTEFAKA